MDAIFMNSASHVFVLKLTDKLDLRKGEKSIALSNGKTFNNNKFKISAPTWNDKFEYLMIPILHQIFKIILSIF